MTAMVPVSEWDLDDLLIPIGEPCQNVYIRCDWCSESFAYRRRPGPRNRYCSPAHRRLAAKRRQYIRRREEEGRPLLLSEIKVRLSRGDYEALREMAEDEGRSMAELARVGIQALLRVTGRMP